MAPDIAVHHCPGDEDGRVWQIVFDGRWVRRLTDDEMHELSAKALLALAGVEPMRQASVRTVDTGPYPFRVRIPADGHLSRVELLRLRSEATGCLTAGHPCDTESHPVDAGRW